MANNAAALAKMAALYPVHHLVPEFYACEKGRSDEVDATMPQLYCVVKDVEGCLCSMRKRRVATLLNDAWHQSMWRCLG
jgi:hypothetical protein